MIEDRYSYEHVKYVPKANRPSACVGPQTQLRDCEKSNQFLNLSLLIAIATNTTAPNASPQGSSTGTGTDAAATGGLDASAPQTIVPHRSPQFPAKETDGRMEAAKSIVSCLITCSGLNEFEPINRARGSSVL